jgi:hypothetical protein
MQSGCASSDCRALTQPTAGLSALAVHADVVATLGRRRCLDRSGACLPLTFASPLEQAAKLEFELRHIETSSPPFSVMVSRPLCLVPFQRNRLRAELPRSVLNVTGNCAMAPA